MKYINILFLLIKNTHCFGFIKPINYKYINHKSKIYMNDIPDYKPLQVINSLAKSTSSLDKWNLNQLLNEINNNNIDSLTLLKKNNIINGVVAIDGHHYDNIPLLNNLHYVETGIDKISDIILNKIVEKNIYYDIFNIPDGNLVENLPVILFNIFCFYLFINILSNLFSRLNGGNSNMPTMNNFMNQNKKISSIIDSNDIDTRFLDIAGCDEAKYELQEIVDFLKNPNIYNDIGAKIPKGVLLEGPPGTGKTLLARAVAGEANVAFISVSASEFIQMFVGVGAARVRELFDVAKKNQPCVIFIDELDAIGRKRGEGFNGGGNEEREQTLNQILTKMDGFDKSDSIVVLAATNRVDILDTALTRSGRFDRKVKVGLPDKQGRRAILDIHLRNKNVNNNTDFEQIASLTSGFSGADIENMANEAIILALRNNTTEITTKYLLDAFEKITIGLPLTNQVINMEKDQLVAYHEAGHTLTALLFKDIFTVRKVTINANTNGAGGYTLFTPLEKYMQYPTKKYFLANMIVAMGGRAAEIVLYNNVSNVSNIIVEDNYNSDIIFGDINDLSVTAGASQDLKQIDRLARQYIELFGIDGNNDIEYPIIQSPNNGYTMLSDKTNRDIEKYLLKLTNMALKQAINIILSNYDSFIMIADELIKKREIDELYLSSIDVNYY